MLVSSSNDSPERRAFGMKKEKKDIGCNLCEATRKASRAGKLKEDSECLACMTSYKKSKGKV